jgi:LysM domain
MLTRLYAFSRYLASVTTLLFLFLVLFVPPNMSSVITYRYGVVKSAARLITPEQLRNTAYTVSAHWVPRYYLVHRGDSLSRIAERYYGNAADWPTLWDYNRIVHNPNLIYVGERLWIPYHPTTRVLRSTITPEHHPVVVSYTYTASGSIESYVIRVFGGNAGCANEILQHESGFSWSDVTIENPGSGAYGLPQALPGDKMSSFGSDWATDPETQLRWMQWYANTVYGGICSAAYHDISTGTY